MKKSILLIALGFALTSCVKDQSTISGTAHFSDSLGNQSIAPNVELVLRANSTLGPVEMTVTTNNNGEYQFNDVTDGQHWMTGEAEFSGHTYSYASDVIFTEKDAPVKIHPVFEW